MSNQPVKKIRISHTQFYELCQWIVANADELHDVKYAERAAMATKVLGFEVTETKAAEASKLTGNETQHGRVNTIYFALVALAASGGTNIRNLARKGRDVMRAAQKDRKEDDGTEDMFPNCPEVPDANANPLETDVLLEPGDEPDTITANTADEDVLSGDLDSVTDPGEANEWTAPDEPSAEEEEPLI